MTSLNDLRVRIAVLTYQRPDDLAAVLTMLLAQVDSVPEVASILVVDNDPDASAHDVVTELGKSNPVSYAHEAVPGISAARNRALDESSESDVVIFIDDDERPSKDWLRLLLQTYAAQACAAVVGPVVSDYAIEPEPWIQAGRFFDRRRLPTGTAVNIAATNNLLLDLHEVRRLGLRFDERFGLSGGSDTLFTRQLWKRGGIMIWCDEAVVIDVVPGTRLTREWVLRRAYRSGNGWIRTELELESSSARRIRIRGKMFARGGIRVLGGASRFVLGAVTGHMGQRARGFRTAARGAGLLSGSLGIVYSEYRR